MVQMGQMLYLKINVMKFNTLTVETNCKIYVAYLEIQVVLCPFCASE
jgi:hypothetical protein